MGNRVEETEGTKKHDGNGDVGKTRKKGEKRSQET